MEVMWEDQREEERLHERGEQLLRETDWVMDIMRLRRALEKRRGVKGKGKLEGVKTGQGEDVRKTRSGRLGGVVGSYKEYLYSEGCLFVCRVFKFTPKCMLSPITLSIFAITLHIVHGTDNTSLQIFPTKYPGLLT